MTTKSEAANAMPVKSEAANVMTAPLITVTAEPAAINARPAQPISSTTQPDAIKAPDPTPAAAWSRRMRRIGGFIQAAFAAFWLARASLAIGGPAEIGRAHV